MTKRPRKFRLHYYKAKNCWTVVLSDGTYNVKRVSVNVPLEGVLQNEQPRAYLTGKGYIRQVDEHTVEITPRLLRIVGDHSKTAANRYDGGGHMTACCKAHIKKYEAIDASYPREGAALCCSECQSRLVYHDGVWRLA